MSDALIKEKLEILKFTNLNHGEFVVCEKSLLHSISQTMVDFSDDEKTELPGAKKPWDELADLFQKYGIAVVKGFLLKIYLLQDTSRLEIKLRAFLQLIKVHNYKAHEKQELLLEIANYSNQPFDINRKVVKLLLHALLIEDDALIQQCLFEYRLADQFKFRIFELLVDKYDLSKNKEHISIVQKTLRKLLHNYQYDWYMKTQLLQCYLKNTKDTNRNIVLKERTELIMEGVMARRIESEVLLYLGEQFYHWVMSKNWRERRKHMPDYMVKPFLHSLLKKSENTLKNHSLKFFLDYHCSFQIIKAAAKKCLAELYAKNKKSLEKMTTDNYLLTMMRSVILENR